MQIAGRWIGAGFPCYIIAELSANHGGSFEHAARLVRAAAACGADAVKLQTARPDRITLNCDRPEFRVGGGTLWDGRTLYDLYCEAHTPWDWTPKLKAIADDLGVHLFSSPFDTDAVAFLQTVGVPAYKIASFELIDPELVSAAAATGQPLIMSTGMATLSEIADAVATARTAGCSELALLKCTSAYPAPASGMNLATIAHLAAAFDVPAGLSDHTLGIAVPVAAVALGAAIIEKHFTLSRSEPGPDSAFSLEPAEFQAMVAAVRDAEQAIGTVRYGVGAAEASGRAFRRSLFVVADMKAGDRFTPENVRSIRPGHGLPPKCLPEILGRLAARDLVRGEPLTWAAVGGC